MSFTSVPAEEPITVEEAQRRVLDAVSPLGSELVPLDAANGRALREDVIAPVDLPQADNTAMDGYAVQARDLTAATKDHPVALRVVADLPAGGDQTCVVVSGTAARIMTGAYLPTGADAVAQVELTDAGSSIVTIFAPVSAGMNVRRRGEDMTAGAVVLPSGIRLGPGEIGVLAASQYAQVAVGCRPTVAILSTGDELVMPGHLVPPGKIVNSNAYALAALVEEAGGEARMLGIVPDSRDATMDAIENALSCDFVLTSGGVSVGAYDFVKEAITALGGETIFWRVSMKPGKPVLFARLRERLFFGLPGNPVSSMVSFHLFVGPALRKASGETSALPTPAILMKTADALRSRGERRTYLRVRVVVRDGELVALPMRAQGSGVSTSMVQANGLAIMDEGIAIVEAGGVVPVMLFGPVCGE